MTEQKIALLMAYHKDGIVEFARRLLALGWKEIVKNPQNIIVVEWADRVSKIIPKNAVRVELRRKGECSREIKLKQQKTARSVI